MLSRADYTFFPSFENAEIPNNLLTMGNLSSYGGPVSEIARLEERVRRLLADVRERRIDRRTMMEAGMHIRRSVDELVVAADDRETRQRGHTLRKHVSFLLDSDGLLSDLEQRLRQLEDQVQSVEVSEQAAQGQGRSIWEAADRLVLARDDQAADNRRRDLQGRITALLDSLLRISALEERLQKLVERACIGIPRDAEQQAAHIRLEANSLQLVPFALGRRKDLINRVQSFVALVTVRERSAAEIANLEERVRRLVSAVQEHQLDRSRMADEGMNILHAIDGLAVAEDDQQAKERRHGLRESISFLLDSDDHLSDLEEQLRSLRSLEVKGAISRQSMEAARSIRAAADRLVLARDDQAAERRRESLRRRIDGFAGELSELSVLEERLRGLEQDVRNNRISKRSAEEEATQISIAADNLELDTQVRGRRRLLLERIRLLSDVSGSGCKRPAQSSKSEGLTERAQKRQR